MVGLGLLWWRIEPLLKRTLDIAEARTRPIPALPKADPMPVDMLAASLEYPDEWAREQAVSRLRELYNELGSWDAVRTVWILESEA